MRDEHLRQIKRALIHGGVKIQYVQRTLLELEEHFHDLEEEARGAGSTAQQARAEAARRLGPPQLLVETVLRQDTLKVPTSRWLWLGHTVRSLLFVIAMPAVPALMCVGRGPAIAKWGVAVTASATVTTAFLLVLGLLVLS